MRRPFQLEFIGLAVLFLIAASVGAPGAPSGQEPQTASSARVEVKLDTQEAEAVLAILDRAGSGQSVEPALWDLLFSSEPYVRLKKREAEIGERFNVPELKFEDEDFKTFVQSDDLRSRAPELRRTLAAWEKADLVKSGARILDYLPSEARIRAKVYPVIKPRGNSFVYEMGTDPAIFLYLDPDVTEAQFENTVAHEMHHIGLASIYDQTRKIMDSLPARVGTAVEWLGAFGEGLAMLAAAGGPDVHPHAVSSAETRARWDKDTANFDSDLRDVERFLLDVLEGRLKTDKEIAEKGSSFLGVQGPWYTVGHRMAVLVEKTFGRERLVRGMVDPRRLLVDYNLAAEVFNRDHKDSGGLAVWSPALLEALGVPGDARSGAASR
jgi:hypothetical protein